MTYRCPQRPARCSIGGHVEIVTFEVYRRGVAMQMKGSFVRRRERHKFVCRLKGSAAVLKKRAERATLIWII